MKKDNLLLVKDIVMDRLYHSILPLHVWNYLFLCERFNYLSSICEFCTKHSIESKEILGYINDNLFVHISYIPHQLKHEFSLMGKVPLILHSNIIKTDKQNLGGIY